MMKSSGVCCVVSVCGYGYVGSVSLEGVVGWVVVLILVIVVWVFMCGFGCGEVGVFIGGSVMDGIECVLVISGSGMVLFVGMDGGLMVFVVVEVGVVFWILVWGCGCIV